MDDASIETPGLDELAEVEAAIASEEEALGLEWVGKGAGLNRAERRAKIRTLKRLTRRPEACHTLEHPLTRVKTPYGIKVLAERRARSKRSRAARKRNR